MSEAPEGTVANPVAEDELEGGGGDDEERAEEVVDLRTCRPSLNGRSVVWTQCLFLLDTKKRAMCTLCAVSVPCPVGNTTNLIAHNESPRVDEYNNVVIFIPRSIT